MSARERFPELVQTSFPELSILAEPGIEIPERFGAKRVEPLLSVRPRMHEARFLQDPKMARYTRLIDLDVLDDVVYRMLAAPEHFDDVEPRRISQDLDGR